MYGSLLGDIIGAPYEFDNGPRNKKFNLFGHPRHRYTDDSLLSIAVAEALMELKKVDMDHLPEGKTKKAVCLETIEKSIRKWSFDPAYERIFRDLKTAYRKLVTRAENTDFNDPEQKKAYDEARKKLIRRCDKYLEFKAVQNRGMFHKRSEIEAHRVALVESLTDRLRNDDFDKGIPAPEDPEARKLLDKAEKKLFLGGKDLAGAAVAERKNGPYDAGPDRCQRA